MCTRVVMTWIAPALAVVFGLLAPRAAQGQELMILPAIPGVTIHHWLSVDSETGEAFSYEYTPFERLAFTEGRREFRAYFVVFPGDAASAVDVTDAVQWSVEPYYEPDEGLENLYRIEGSTVHFLDAWIQDGRRAKFRVYARLGEEYEAHLSQLIDGSLEEFRASVLQDIAQLMQEVIEHAVGLVPSAAQLREKAIDAVDRCGVSV